MMGNPRTMFWWLVIGVMAIDSAMPSASSDFVFQEQLADEPIVKKKYVKTTSYAQSGYSKQGSSYSKSSGSSCTSMPTPPVNSKLSCSGSDCRANCMRNYQLPNGKDMLTMSCVKGKWTIDGNIWKDMPSCEPVCSPPCQNNGICINPGECACADNYMGTFCEKKKQLCLSRPPMPKNSKLSVRGTAAVITCMAGHKFPDGTSITNMECFNGAWKPSRAEQATVPDCQPVCTEPCLNGGTCISVDVCHCMSTYRGPQCQYSVESCSTKRLNFNGAYSCKGDNVALKCQLSCPASVEFEFAPASEYVCTYSTGKFQPEDLPQCKIPPGMEIIKSEGISKTFYENSQWSQGNSSSSSSSSSRKKSKQRISYESEEDGDDEDVVEITKIKIRKHKKKHHNYLDIEDESGEYEQSLHSMGMYSMYESNSIGIQHRIPKPAVCMTWNGNKVKTFDGLTYAANMYCSHILIQDLVDGSFNVILRSCPFDSQLVNGECTTQGLIIFLQSTRYTFEVEDGLVRLFLDENRPIPIPIQRPGIRVSMMGHKLKVVMDAIGVVVLWDTKMMVTIEVSAALFNRTAGLCGSHDQSIRSDFRTKDGTIVETVSTFVDSWTAPSVDIDPQKCVMNDNQNSKLELECLDDVRAKAKLICKKLIDNPMFSNCLKEFDAVSLLETCISDYCFCKDKQNPAKCCCEGVSVFAKDCQFRGIAVDNGWRDMELCPMPCTNGRVYNACGPSFEPSCGSTVDEVSTTCNEGCFCPEGTLQHKNQCVFIETCPCVLRGKTFQPGEKIKKDCNTCTCGNGKWLCSEKTCGARCGAIGDPHYLTFDGKRFDFMGKCSYYLMKTDNYSIEAENVACSGELSADLGYSAADQPSCTKSVTIHLPNGKQAKSIKLKQGGVVLVDGLEISKLPTKKFDGLLKVRQASSIMIVVTFADGVNVWWDGMTNVFIDVPASYRGRTAGLCGTFNSNIQDDFLSPEGDVESSVVAFADKWRTKEMCQFAPNTEQVPHPCQVNLENKARAIKVCKKLQSKLFEECHWHVDPDQYYEDCMYDMCACKGTDLSQCLCPVLSSYASECARQGVIINWRHSVNECSVKCPIGQVFEQCGDTCFRTCEDYQNNEPCRTSCVEGCRCPPGQSLNEHKQCIPTKTCSCVYNGLVFNSNYKEIRPGTKHLDLCTCAGGSWNCVQASETDKIKYPPAADKKAECLSINHEEFTTCETEPKTCKNMHDYQPSTPAECHSGCVCQKDYVFDSFAKKCILPKDCACHHGGHSYVDGDTIKENCNVCACKAGSWECTKNVCPAICTSWGDSHFETFDGVYFDFQGVCNYILSKGTLSNGEGFTVAIQNVLCGSLGVTCSKSLTISILGSHPDSIQLIADHTRGKSIATDLTAAAEKLKRISVNEVGLYTVVEVAGMGFQVKWDYGTRIYIKLDIMWRGVVQGLCGNFNGNVKDEFKSPSGGIENNAEMFGHSWKLQDFCEPATGQIDTCKAHPQREVWSQRQCGVLKSDLFKPCHGLVPLDEFMKRCIYDTCACDQGGDCECLCTAIAAYAHACSTKGVAIRWRTQNLCPMQCDTKCSEYTPCLKSSCPIETCDNLLVRGKDELMCVQDTCLEGCEPKPCPEGHLYLNATYTECVHKSVCKSVCLQVDGVTYYEGDIMKTDACHTCRCTRGKSVCTGVPCTTSHDIIHTTTPRPQHDSGIKCITGYTEWINQDSMGKSSSAESTESIFKDGDKEPLPSELLMRNLLSNASCPHDLMTHIECRTVKTHLSPKDTGENVECSLERGLLGVGKCQDYEIRVYCQCSGAPIKILETTTETAWKKPTKPPPVSENCDPAIPHVEYPGDCYKFLHCLPQTDGSWKYAEKTCGPTMMYNPLSMTCDWIASVKSMKPQCGTEKIIESTPSTPYSICPDGTVWDECAIPCQRSCHYYKKKLRQMGVCHAGSNECEPGCMNATIAVCPYGKLRRDERSCVDEADCTCMSLSGLIAKPGVIHREASCKTCQCLGNEYICDSSSCLESPTTATPPSIITYTTTTIPNIIISTMTPPVKCDRSNLVPVINGKNPLHSKAFAATSNYGISFRPEFSKLNSKATADSAGSWSPSVNDRNQYLQITFDKVLPIHGVIMQGSPIFDQYVTSFKILYSHDGLFFGHYVTTENSVDVPQVFRGPIDNRQPVETLFQVPIEAKSVRIYPLTWHESISIRLELLGCETTSPVTQAPEAIMCDEPMGVDKELLHPSQVKVSSSKSPKNIIDTLRLSAPNGWSPKLNKINEFVMFDFLEPRIIHAIKTAGGYSGWVTAYKVEYSMDAITWNVVEGEDGKPNQFPANFDEYSAHLASFPKPINTRYLKIVPVTWHNTIEMKIEPFGCYKPYPKVVEEVPVVHSTVPPPSKLMCDVCKGVLNSAPLDGGVCRCYPPLVWNGKECIPSSECPCMVGHIAYPVGSKYELDDCSECNCLLGGTDECKPKKCPVCAKGLRPVKAGSCSCRCEPCPANEVLCETSKVCIAESSWCDGVQDCPDDEQSCFNKNVATFTETTIVKKCVISCPPGSTYKEMHKNETVPRKTSAMFRKSDPTNLSYGSSAEFTTDNEVLEKPKIISKTAIECLAYTCIPNKPVNSEIIQCPKKECPKDYDLVLEKAKYKPNECDKFTCEPQIRVDAVCNVTCRTFNTFDGTQLKYDICNHVLARDLVSQKWSISIIKDCTIGHFVCDKKLLIRDREMDTTVRLFTNLTLEWDDYEYTVEHLQASTSTKLQSFTISKVGNTLIYVSHFHGFWVIFDSDGDVKIGVFANKATTVDGLCGYFDGIATNDKRKPNGDLSASTSEFGDSWSVGKSNKEICEPHSCPKKVQDLALKMCKTAKDDAFKQCGQHVDVDRFVSQCMETACDCIMASETKDSKTDIDANSPQVQKCKCKMLEDFVNTCLSLDNTFQLDNWRSIHECVVECPAGLVHRDCYQRRCELTCETIRNSDEDCPHLPGTCFPGCYCPEGSVRKGKDCVPLLQCTNCNCEGFGQSQYLNYDRTHFSFDGECTYLLSRDIQVVNTYTFQIYTTLGKCADSSIATNQISQKSRLPSCTKALHILYGSHIVHLTRGTGEKITITMDGIDVAVLPLNRDWISIVERTGKNIQVNLPKAYVQISAAFEDMAFSIQVPSIKYESKMEGLCGNCDGITKDDLKPNPKAKIPAKSNSVRDIVQTWLADDPKLPKEHECIPSEEIVCTRLPKDQDLCLELMDVQTFGRCHLIVDPKARLSACREDMCKSGTDRKAVCKHLSAYASECSSKNICVDWKRDHCNENRACPVGMTYKACACQKTCETVVAQNQSNDDICPLTEGCVCPDGLVNNNGKCIPEKNCRPCDAFGHNDGDKWMTDKCTECTCDNKKTICLKRDCPAHGAICEIGFQPISVPTNGTECCPVYKCVPSKVNSNCTETTLPDCAPDQQIRKITASNGCPRVFCECKPFAECPPLKILKLNPGEKMITDTTGCCPVHKIVCDKKLCPPEPITCEQEFFEVQVASDDSSQCCIKYECVPPKYTCIVDIDGKKSQKAIGESWPTSDPCVTERCAYGPNATNIVVNETVSCGKAACKLGSKLNTIPGQCCGQCKQHSCVFEDTIHKVDDHWTSLDNCTTYQCVQINNEFIVTSSKEKCPNLDECPESQRYIDGCCQRCKPATPSQVKSQCDAISLSDTATTELVEKNTKMYGKCRNKQPIRGYAECSGFCSSGTRYNKATYKQFKECTCCSVATTEDIVVPLTCETGYVLDLVISVPKTCTCKPCDV